MATTHNQTKSASILIPNDLHKEQQEFLTNKYYIELKKEAQMQMNNILKDKTKDNLKNECSNETCSTANNDKIWDECPSLQRIKIIIDVYKNLISKYTKLWKIGTIASIVATNVYEYQQLVDDFNHVKAIHMDKDMDDTKHTKSSVTYLLCTKFEQYYKCDVKTCAAAKLRRDRQITTQDEDDHKIHTCTPTLNEEVVFREEVDKIHSYFLHSLLYNDADDGKKHVIVCEPWWNDINSAQYTNDKDLYRFLVKSYGIFSFQSIHGFRTGDTHSLSQLKPKFQDLKDEVLHNKYHSFAKDQWDDTIKKCDAKFVLWSTRKIRTVQADRFEDKITGQRHQWKTDVSIKLREIITLKLYTDFAKLAYELKKCMRFESFATVLNDRDLKMDENILKERLYERLRQFYHWRSFLLIILNKFGKRLSKKKLKLYHGVNAKMVFNTSETFAFWGPLSTTTSFLVAKSFATHVGIVLEITTHYPRLKYCNAFDVSGISDYPGEDEWLIGFIYLRVLKVTAKDINLPTWSIKDKSDSDIQKYTGLIAASIRATFFAVHLFKEQIYSMSNQLGSMLAAFIRCSLNQCCAYNKNNKDEQTTKWLCRYVTCSNTKTSNANTTRYKQEPFENTANFKKAVRIYKMLYNKFQEFRNTPNKKQSVKIDNISDELKEFFLENGKISFTKIIKLYPNIKEIHLVNHYTLDNYVLKDLSNVMKNKNNQPIYLQKIKLLCYHPVDIDNQKPEIHAMLKPFYENKKAASKILFHPFELNEDKLNAIQLTANDNNVNKIQNKPDVVNVYQNADKKFKQLVSHLNASGIEQKHIDLFFSRLDEIGYDTFDDLIEALITNDPKHSSLYDDFFKDHESMLKEVVNCMNAMSTKINAKNIEENNNWNIAKRTTQVVKQILQDIYPAIYEECSNDRSILYVLAVGYINGGQSLLSNIIDGYLRDRINSGLYDVYQIVDHWFKDSPIISIMMDIKDVTIDGFSYNADDLIKEAIHVYFRRIAPKLMFKNYTRMQESLYVVSHYFWQHCVLLKDIIIQSKTDTNLRPPFQMDVMIAIDPNDVKTIDDIDCSDNDSDNDDDDVDDDDDDDDDQPNGTIIDHNIEDGLNDAKCFYEKTTLHHPTDLTNLLKSVCGSQQLNQKRFCFFLDRRNVAKSKSKEFIDEQKWHLKDWCPVCDATLFIPPNDCNHLPRDDILHLGHFNNLKRCLIPKKGDNINNININSVCKGLITWAFYVESADLCKCYICINGQVSRFMPNDIINVLPKFFGGTYQNNNNFVNDPKIKEMVQSISKLKLFVDKELEKFCGATKGTKHT